MWRSVWRSAAVALAVIAHAAHVAQAQTDARRILAGARAAQRTFERERRDRLPSTPGGASGPCEVRIGRLCYWNNNGDPPPAPEPFSIAVARDSLLARLARASIALGTADSAEEWIVGQRVRYLSEARRRDEAVDAARACRAATPWWCDALRGLAFHERNDHEAAAASFDTALARMSSAERCRWTDLSWWLDGALEREYRRTPCGPARDAWERRFWIAARPLLMLPGNDLRSELLARRTMARIRSQGAMEYAMPWGDDFAELEVRYGWPVAWSARESTSYYGTSEPRSVVGHEPTPSFTFVPAPGAVAAPHESAPRDWSLDAPLAAMRYAPRYAPRGVVALPHQLARFRRGDSTLVVGAWDVTHDRSWQNDSISLGTTPRAPLGTASRDSLARDTLRAALVLVDTSLAPRGERRSDVAAHGALALLVPDGAYLASLELWSPPDARGRAARARYGVPALPRDTLASDLLLLADVPSPGAPLDSLLRVALGTRTIVAGTPVGLYWETYLPVDTTDATHAEVTVRATRIDAAWYERLGRALRLGALVGGPQTPVAVRFVDAVPPRAGTTYVPRTLSLTWPADAPGTYRLDVTVRVGERAAVSSEIVRVVKP